MRYHVSVCIIAASALVAMPACDDDEPQSHVEAQQLVPALLTVDDVSFVPADWEENMRTVVQEPVPPFDGTLDPYLCTEAALPAAFTMPQAQLELTGGGLMEVLLGTEDADSTYDSLVAAYESCGDQSSLAYRDLAGVPSVGDESQSFESDLGFLTLARFGDTLMILRWMVGDFAEQGFEYYPRLVEAAAAKLSNG